MLHDTESGLTYWTDARQYLRDPHTSNRAYIPVPKTNILQHTTAVKLFETAGVTGDAFISDLKDVMFEMAKRRIDAVAFPVSFFDLFAQGLTLIARSVYYGIDLAMAAAKFNMGLQDLPNLKEQTEFDLTLGLDEHNFLFDYVKFLVTQNLANIDFADCLVEWVNREMHPHFVAPLSSRGRQLIWLIDRYEGAMAKAGVLEKEEGLKVCQEGLFEMMQNSYVRRVPRIHFFQKRLLELDKSPVAKP